MQQGLVALIDALGFRGIWSEFSEDQLLGTLHRVRDEIRQQDPDIHVRLLSDTFVLASSLPPDDPDPGDSGYWLTFRFMRALAGVQATAALSTPPLLYRGCIAHGSVLIDGDFIVGQAVDEAAEWMEQADGAFIWLAPSALALYNAGQSFRMAERSVALEYDVPLRNGRTVRTLAVNPLAGYPSDGSMNRTEHLHRVLADKLSLAFHRPRGRMHVDVFIKKQRTEAFLEAAADHWEGVVAAEAAQRRAVWGGVDPLEDPSVIERMKPEGM
jgi:hypothetical protein